MNAFKATLPSFNIEGYRWKVREYNNGAHI